MFELNNISLELPHPLREVCDAISFEGQTDRMDLLRPCLAIASELYATEGEETEDESTLENVFPMLDGTALFSVICTLNHSCAPNCSVHYSETRDAELRVTRDIDEGEELCISYISTDQDYAARQEDLRYVLSDRHTKSPPAESISSCAHASGVSEKR
jgi:hypothetical protein